jgi:hypothetical protein
MKSSSSMYRSVEDLDRRELTASRAEQQRLEKELEEERQRSRKMGERLVEREKKILYLSSMRQIEVNRSVDRQEESSGWSCGSVLLAAFLLLLVGYSLSQYDLPLSLE